MRSLLLMLALAAFWMALSGYFKPILLIFGAATVVLAVYVAHRMRVSDKEGVPAEFVPAALAYWPWLIWEMLKSSWAVAMILVHPKLPISPTMTVIRARQKTEVGIAVFANSITLTPGTVTTNVDGAALTVHAIVRDGADDLEAGGMNDRVAQIEKSPVEIAA